jgi:tetratricopeptide (TPR) repeat protein
MSFTLRTGDAMLIRSCLLAIAPLALAVAQTPARPTSQPPGQQRDLKLEKIDDTVATKLSGHSYAVVVGVSQYPNLPADKQLQFAERDAQSIYTILISPEGGNFKAENVKVLTGPQATLAAMKSQIDNWLPSVAQDDDRVLIYFAGHGFVYKGKGYLAPSDFKLEQADTTGYPMDELGAVIGSKIHAKWKILLTDACHSGAISPEDTQSLNQKLSTLNESLFSLTASRDREQSFESPDLQGGHGVFTYFVVKGLEGGADYSHDGKVTADELAEYVRSSVREATQDKQTPTSDKGSFDPNMWLSFVPSTAAPATPPPPQFGTLIFTANTDGVEVFVDNKSIGVLQKNKAFPVPGLPPGQHTIKGVKMGYEPDGPRQETVYPGTDSAVTIKILIPRHRDKAATDALDKGIELYQKGDAASYKKAAEQLEKALQLDPTYSQAAYYLGLSYSALFDYDKAQLYYKKAIEIDPDYLEAHANYAGMLLDIGDVDEAIRQINTVLVRQPNHAVALTMLAQADRLKELYPQSIDAARKAIKITPKDAEPHLWLGDSLRLTGKLADAQAEYQQYLNLSDFDSHLGGQLNYYVLGSLFGMGKKHHAGTRDIWKELRSLALFGICDCQYQQKQYDLAIGYCQKSLTYNSKDPFAHYSLGLSFMHKAVDTGNVATLGPALLHFQEVVAINPDMDEAKAAQQNIATIQRALQH